MKISIIVPVYNVEPYVERCLLSVLNQSYENLELVIVDDCGTDNSMDIVHKIVANYKEDKAIQIYVHEKNRGLSAARNTGIIHASGDCLLFLDSDDEIPSDAVAKLASVMADDVDFVIGNVKVSGSNSFHFNFSVPEGPIAGNEAILHSFVGNQWYSMAVNKLIRKSFIVKNQLFFKEGILHEDELWSFQLALKAQKMLVIRDYTYHYLIRNDSITGRLSIRNYECNAIVLCEKYKLLVSSNDKLVVDFVFKQILNFYYSLLRFRPPYQKLNEIRCLIKGTLLLMDTPVPYNSIPFLLKYIFLGIPTVFLKPLCRG